MDNYIEKVSTYISFSIIFLVISPYLFIVFLLIFMIYNMRFIKLDVDNDIKNLVNSTAIYFNSSFRYKLMIILLEVKKKFRIKYHIYKKELTLKRRGCKCVMCIYSDKYCDYKINKCYVCKEDIYNIFHSMTYLYQIINKLSNVKYLCKTLDIYERMDVNNIVFIRNNLIQNEIYNLIMFMKKKNKIPVELWDKIFEEYLN